jgi:DNA primase small subunit
MASGNKDAGADLVNKLISDFYRTASDLAPDRMAEREFGVGNFEVKISQRHMSFRNELELKEYLCSNAVPYVSASSAYYRFPSGRPMEKKGWLGSELVFDLDVTDMELPCQLRHGKSWVCSSCLEEVRKETIKLVYDFLVPDFGFSEKEIAVNFSGNRGYHVHVKNGDVLMLDAAARKEITGYISGIGIDFERLFPTAGRRGEKLVGPSTKDKGWKGKIAKNFLSNLNAGVDSLMRMGVDKPIATKLYRSKSLVQMGIDNGNWDMVYIKNKGEFWKRIVEGQAVSQSDRIDRNVTNDPGHLIRLPNSIHGGTGLIARRLGAPRELYRFNPMKEAIAFRKGFVKIKAGTKYPLEMAEQRFGPYAGEIKVPTYVGVYLYLRGLASIINFI